MTNRILALGIFLLLTISSYGQNGVLEEYFFESGKIKVVFAVALCIAIGLYVYLFRLDKKIGKLENKSK